MPRYAPNKMPTEVKKRYFELIRRGMKGAAAARIVGVSTSCGSLWFIDAGSMIVTEPRAISPRFLTQDDRIAIADGLRVGLTKHEIAEQIGKTFQTVYREIKRNSKPDGTYQPWWAHNQAVLRRRRPKLVKLEVNEGLRTSVLAKLTVKWSPQQIARHLARTAGDDRDRRVCTETIYRALFSVCWASWRASSAPGDAGGNDNVEESPGGMRFRTCGHSVNARPKRTTDPTLGTGKVTLLSAVASAQPSARWSNARAATSSWCIFPMGTKPHAFVTR